ncbi:hypothetical protein DPMN_153505 [Dreissena polymorpha]|uniref:Uncharacterized protein n=1 Tax=Dreissena polymorpha TaxID=45954 RepID=A0A9D4FNA8_DREPO|nr:hypothetical protein DPMN_153505 [Dreissena polymorpha]
MMLLRAGAVYFPTSQGTSIHVHCCRIVVSYVLPTYNNRGARTRPGSYKTASPFLEDWMLGIKHGSSGSKHQARRNPQNGKYNSPKALRRCLALA